MFQAHFLARLILIAGLLPAGLAHAAPPPALERVQLSEGLSRPESAHYDAHQKSWFVSNIGGTEPGDGYISRLDAGGEIVEEFFASALDDPKGLAILGDELFVADVNRIVAIRLAQPGQRRVFPVPGALFLNDVAVDRVHERVYVSDTLGHAIYQLADGELSTLIEGSELEAPNGLWVDGGDLLVATIGPDLDPNTFSTSAPGRVLRYDLQCGQLTPASERFGSLDGITPLDRHRFLVSDFRVGVYLWRPGEAPTLLLPVGETGLTSTADIGFDRSHGRLLIPDVGGVGVALYEVRSDACR